MWTVLVEFEKISIMIWIVFFILGSNAFASKDFSTPEATVMSYQSAYNEGDQETVANSFDPPAKNFYLAPKNVRMRITKCKIKETRRHSAAEIKKQNDLGIVPQLRVGDLKVIQICKVDGKRTQEFRYDLRKIGQEWKIISHSATGVP